MKFARLLLLLTLFLAACGQPSVDDSALATSIAMAVQLTTLADEAAVTPEVSPTAAEVVPPSPTPTLEPTATSEPTQAPTEEPTATPYEVPDWPLFRNGDDGPEVFALQALLRAHGYDLTVDGAFGPVTRSRVIAFQGDEGLAADGIVGPNTWEALIDLPVQKEGNSGFAVRALQHLLNEKFGYNQVAVDGDFGPITEAAVQDFQQSYDLQVDGIVGPQTWQALVAIQP